MAIAAGQPTVGARLRSPRERQRLDRRHTWPFVLDSRRPDPAAADGRRLPRPTVSAVQATRYLPPGHAVSRPEGSAGEKLPTRRGRLCRLYPDAGSIWRYRTAFPGQRRESARWRDSDLLPAGETHRGSDPELPGRAGESY